MKAPFCDAKRIAPLGLSENHQGTTPYYGSGPLRKHTSPLSPRGHARHISACHSPGIGDQAFRPVARRSHNTPLQSTAELSSLRHTHANMTHGTTSSSRVLGPFR